MAAANSVIAEPVSFFHRPADNATRGSWVLIYSSFESKANNINNYPISCTYYLSSYKYSIYEKNRLALCHN